MKLRVILSKPNAGVVVLALLLAGGCNGPLPPPGTLHVGMAGSKGDPQIRNHSVYSDMTFNLNYGGPRQWLAWGAEEWKDGKPSPVQAWKRYAYTRQRQILSFSIQDERFNGKPPGYGLLMDLKYESSTGGSEKSGGGLTLPNPDLPLAWTASIPGAAMDIQSGQEKAVWALFKHTRPFEAQEGLALEELASRAAWAVLVKVRMEN